jgi:hypothetical protein
MLNKLSVSWRVAVDGKIVEGEKEGPAPDEKFPGNSEIVEMHSIDPLIERIHKDWGVNADIEIFIWRANYKY